MSQAISYYDSPIGLLAIHADDVGITAIDFVKKRGKAATDINPHLVKCVKQLDAYFKGRLKVFDVPLSTDGTAFQNKVWQALRQIPFGKTSSYGEVAKKIRQPKAARAVGMANNRNPIPIIVPCHRVVGTNGSLVGYACGIAKKQWLLKHEGCL